MSFDLSDSVTQHLSLATYLTDCLDSFRLKWDQNRFGRLSSIYDLFIFRSSVGELLILMFKQSAERVFLATEIERKYQIIRS